MEIAEFIAQRLAVEERDAQDAAAVRPGHWELETEWTDEDRADVKAVFDGGGWDNVASERASDGSMPREAAVHLVRQQPAATLARVEALRALVGLHRTTSGPEVPETGYNATVCDVCGPHEPGDDGWELEGIDLWVPVMYPCPTLRHVAAIWATHPDYDESWRP